MWASIYSTKLVWAPIYMQSDHLHFVGVLYCLPSPFPFCHLYNGVSVWGSAKLAIPPWRSGCARPHLLKGQSSPQPNHWCCHCSCSLWIVVNVRNALKRWTMRKQCNLFYTTFTIIYCSWIKSTPVFNALKTLVLRSALHWLLCSTSEVNPFCRKY